MVNKDQTRKPFVAPELKEEASLVDVTLLSHGGHTRHGNNRRNNHGNRHGNGHGNNH